ncbi:MULTISPECIES: site-specific integrase [unclassified Mycobacterium]|uniref:tyrosine-type recombinase/integrase n=1 Tax=unclassified Mycobacterium TaxID=2642494 RepID=UPI0007FFF199|nr:MULTISPECIES: site-specific integrase [unclassified Mycobacterium]OBG75342.1 integrase [Mycobacterium sp. E1214]OBH31596.1 integrase [Mycobacterium sp. E1319]
MTNGLTNAQDFWASIRTRERANGDKSYAVLYRLDGGQRVLTFRDEKLAEAFKAAIKAHGIGRALELHGYEIRTDDPAPAMTVAQWVRRHIDNLTGVEQYTLDSYERYLRQDIEPHLGNIPLAKLTEEDIAGWVKHLESTPRTKTGRVPTPKTIRNLHGFLSGALAAAVPKHIPANPAAGRRLPRATGEASDDDIDGDDVRMLSHEEFAALLDATIDHYKPMLRFMVASGFRWGEVSALKPGDVDREAGTVKVRRAWKYASKGYYIGPPKTKRSRRTVNIPKDVLDALDYDHEWLFTNAHGGPVRYPAFRAMWDRSVAKAKLDDNPTPHCLRHTCGSWLLAAGEPLVNVSRHLGHENVAVTADVYAHVDRRGHQAIADTMAKLLTTSPGG